MSQPTNTLFSCPFCGADNPIASNGERHSIHTTYRIQCRNSECLAKIEADSEHLARLRWNRTPRLSNA